MYPLRMACQRRFEALNDIFTGTYMVWNKSLIGIDIGSSSVKICELSRSGKLLKNLCIQQLPGPAIYDGEIRDPDMLRQLIIKQLKENKFNLKGKRAAIAVSGSGVMIKRCLLTPEDDSDIEEQAFYEAKQIFENDIDELLVRYTKIGEPTGDGRIPFLIIGARRDIVEQNVGLIKSIGLKTGVIDCSAIAIANSFEHNYPIANQLVILANIGLSSTQIIVSYNGEFLYTREIPIGGMNYNASIMEKLGVDEDNSEVLKLSASHGEQEHEGQILEALSQVNEKIASEVSTTLHFFLENEDYPENMTKQGQIFLMGGASRTSGLDSTIAAILEMPVQFANPFHRINHNKSGYSADYILNQGHLYGVSLGLALRSFGDHD